MPVNRATTLTAFQERILAAGLEPRGSIAGVDRLRETPAKLNFHIYGDLAAIESDWRRFEREADCTAFQTFDWLSSWHRNIGLRQGVHLAIIVGRYSDDEIAFIMPLCVEPQRLARRLCWLGQKLCDYNGPLLAPDFSQRVPRESFLAALAGAEGADADAIRCCVMTGSSLRRCRKRSALKSIHSPFSGSR